MEFRSASIRLFGHLNKACQGDCEDVFLEQVVGGLAPLLLHLQDPQPPVAAVSSQGGWAGRARLTHSGTQSSACALQACRFALRMCGPNLECEELAAIFQKHLQEGRGLHFGEFLNTTCKHLVRGGAAGPGRGGAAGPGRALRLRASCRCTTSPTCWAAC